VQLMETGLANQKEKPRVLHLVCLSVELMAMLMVLLTEKGLVHLMASDWVKLMAKGLEQPKEKPKEMSLVHLSDYLMVMQTVLMMEMNLVQLTEKQKELHLVC